MTAFRPFRAACALLLAGAMSVPAAAGSLRLMANAPLAYDFADLPSLPTEFGRGEFSFELWIKPDNSFPVGPTDPASFDQLKNWADFDPKPYSSHGWWITGNWLLDGHTRPEGYDFGNSREGSFSLQLYGGGRLRWTFADGKEGLPKGMVWAVQAWPAKNAPSLLDGKWHHAIAVRRWREPSGATLELWVDGTMVGSTDIPGRVDMRKWWDHLAHPDDPKELGGWAIGSEVMTAWHYAFTQFEDYKGLIDDIRLWGRALTPAEIKQASKGGLGAGPALLAHFPFDETRGVVARDRLNPGYRIQLHRSNRQSWSRENAPVKEARTR